MATHQDKSTNASAQSGIAPPELDEIAGREQLLAVADMLDEIDAMIAAKRYDEAEVKLAEAKALSRGWRHSARHNGRRCISYAFRADRAAPRRRGRV